MLSVSLADEDKAIVVLLAKLADTTDQSAAQLQTESAKREADERATAADYALADQWLTDRDDVAASIDGDVAARFPGDDRTNAAARRMVRQSRVLEAWRAAGAPGSTRGKPIGQRTFESAMMAIADMGASE
jgi:hypothetical protein